MGAVIFDVDGTLSDPSHRLHFVTGDRRDWESFFAGMGDDPCHQPIVDLLHRLRSLGRDDIIICSARPEDYREVTEAWLRQNGIEWDALYMRPADDTRPDFTIKMQLLAGMREDGFDPWLVIDDRPSVVAAWREAGLTCLQCRDWDERPPVEPGLLTLLVGPSGAGKTSWLGTREAMADFGIDPSSIVSSDGLREELCGDFRDQSRNAQVFSALHDVVKARVRNGLAAVVDATNIRRKDRLVIVNLTSGPVRYIVIDRPLWRKRMTAGWRAEVKDAAGKPLDLIGKQHETFRSQLKDILSGDRLPNVTVHDLRRVDTQKVAA